jgi:hypothetical protein
VRHHAVFLFGFILLLAVALGIGLLGAAELNRVANVALPVVAGLWAVGVLAGLIIPPRQAKPG